MAVCDWGDAWASPFFFSDLSRRQFAKHRRRKVLASPIPILKAGHCPAHHPARRGIRNQLPRAPLDRAPHRRATRLARTANRDAVRGPGLGDHRATNQSRRRDFGAPPVAAAARSHGKTRRRLHPRAARGILALPRFDGRASVVDSRRNSSCGYLIAPPRRYKQLSASRKSCVPMAATTNSGACAESIVSFKWLRITHAVSEGY